MDVVNLLSVSVYEGMVYAFVALGVYITFRVLAFPDLTVDGSFPLGGAVAAILIVNGANPWLATFAAIVAGLGAGLMTSLLNTKLRINALLAGIRFHGREHTEIGLPGAGGIVHDRYGQDVRYDPSRMHLF